MQTLLAQPPKREFRGVWVATVANIDWPSAAGLTTRTAGRDPAPSRQAQA